MEFNNILVSGGAGFIGSNLVNNLLKHYDVNVIIVDNLSTGNLHNISDKDRVVIHVIDISRYDELYSSLQNHDIDIIFHLAAITSLEESMENPYKAFHTNVVGTLNLLELGRRLDIKGFIYSSSVAVYGEPTYLPIDENHPLNPINFYGYTKLKGEELIREYSSLYGLRYVILRYFNVYGPRMRGGQYSGVIHKFIINLLNNKRPIIYGDGNQTRDFIYVDDIVSANIKSSMKLVNDVFNIGTGVETKIIDLLKYIADLVDVKDVEPIYQPKRKGDIYRSVSDSSKAYKILGWRAETKLIDGLRETLKWYKGIQ